MDHNNETHNIDIDKFDCVVFFLAKINEEKAECGIKPNCMNEGFIFQKVFLPHRFYRNEHH